MPFDPGDNYLVTPSGLIIPGEYGDLLKSQSLARKEVTAGRYFADWATPTYGIQTSAAEKPPYTPSFPALREKRDRSPIDKIIINTRMAQVRHVAKICYVPRRQIGLRVVHKRYADPAFKASPSVQARCRYWEDVIEHPAKWIHPGGLTDVLSMACEEELTIDRKVMIIDRAPAGHVREWRLIDGSTCRPVMETLIPFMRDQGYRDPMVAAEVLSYNNKVDLTDAAYVQIIDEQIKGAWRADEISIHLTNPTIEINKVLYGRSLLEGSLATTDAFLAAWNYNNEMFKTNMPEVMLIVQGNYDERGLEQFRRKILQSNGPAGNWRVPLIPGSKEFDIQARTLRPPLKDMLFNEFLHFLVAIKTAAYRMHPSEINFDAATTVDSMINGGSEEQQISHAKEEGFHSLLDNLARWLTSSLIEPADPDLICIWEGLERQTEAERIALNTQKLQYQTMDEVRAQEDLLPIKLPKDIREIDPAEVPLNPIYVQLLELQLQADQLALAKQQAKQAQQMQEQQMAMAQTQAQQAQPAQQVAAQQDAHQQAQTQQQTQMAQDAQQSPPQPDTPAPGSQEESAPFWGAASPQSAQVASTLPTVNGGAPDDEYD